jgi:hypothetical protein
MISCYVRNNGVLTTGLRVGSANDWSSNYFANRLVVKLNSGVSTVLRVNLDFFYRADLIPNAWIGGFFMIPLTPEDMSMSNEDLSKKYTYELRQALA